MDTVRDHQEEGYNQMTDKQYIIGILTKYLDRRARSQSKFSVYKESSGTFIGGSMQVKRKSFTASTSVVFTHGLGKIPFVQVAFDNGDSTYNADTHVLYDVVHDSVNQITVTFSVSNSGIILVMG